MKAELDAELDALLQSDVNKEMSEEEVEKMKKVKLVHGFAHERVSLNRLIHLFFYFAQSLAKRRVDVFNGINVTKIKVRLLHLCTWTL